ncbi:uncharacterized protein LOC117611676 isoform X1 [Osmia lignaria lignaria]|uniref:uncharacterized protein LOC117611676 isoform X1 n=1 Tax=Osmia lignaria lignaria TaxID=1437193 RepID=UPI00402B5F50
MDEIQKIEILKQELIQAEKEKSETFLTIISLENEIEKTEYKQTSNEEVANDYEYEVDQILRQSKNVGMRREDRWETRKADEYRLKAIQAEHHIERLYDSREYEERKITQLDKKIDKLKLEINSINCQNQSSTSGYGEPSTSKSPKMYGRCRQLYCFAAANGPERETSTPTSRR